LTRAPSPRRAAAKKRTVTDPAGEAVAVVRELRKAGTAKDRAGMARFGITGDVAGVSLAAMKPIEKRYARDHAFAAALWKTGLHEARIMACDLDEPDKVTSRQMDTWAGQFDNWAVCDGACLHLFVATPFVEEKIAKWAGDEREFVRRAAFSLIACYTVHGKKVPDERFLPYLDLIERHATDPRNFVRKAVNWALRQIGKRSSRLYRPALALAEKLAAADDRTARWIGKDAVRELSDPKRRAEIAAR
jgi:3-methyladenine DNA glycosylase AlkD